MKISVIAAMLLVLALTFAARVPALYEYLGWDEGNYAYVASDMLRGVAPYTANPIDKEPGIFFLYGGVQNIVGNDSFSIRLFGALWVLAGTLLVFVTGCTLAGAGVGVAAAFFYGLSMAGINNCGIRTNTEVFMTVFQTAAYLLAYLCVRNRKPVYLLAAGVALGLNISLKLTAVLDVAGVCTFVMLYLFADRKKEDAVAFAMKSLALGATGAAVALVPFVAYIAGKGALGAAFDQVVMSRFHNVGRAATSAGLPLEMLKQNALPILVDSAGMAVAALGTVIWAGIFRRDGRLLLMLVWLALAAVAVSASGRFTAYYFPLIVPPLSVLAGYGIAELANAGGVRARPYLWATVGVFMLASVGVFVHNNTEYYARFIDAMKMKRAGEITAEEFHTLLQPDVADSYEAADYVRERTGPDDYVFFWLNSGEFYWRVGRRASSGMPSPIPINRDNAREAGLKARMLADVMAHMPKYFAVRDVYMMYSIPPIRSTAELEAFAPLNDFLRARYVLENVVGRILIYRLAGADAVPSEPVRVFFPEYMSPTLGYQVCQDWFMYSDGTLTAEFTADGCAGEHIFNVVAKGDGAGGVYPHISVYVDGAQSYDTSVQGGAFRDYRFTLPLAAGRHTVKVAYDNNAAPGLTGAPGEDRNLYFRRLEIGCVGNQMHADGPPFVREG